MLTVFCPILLLMAYVGTRWTAGNHLSDNEGCLPDEEQPRTLDWLLGFSYMFLFIGCFIICISTWNGCQKWCAKRRIARMLAQQNAIINHDQLEQLWMMTQQQEDEDSDMRHGLSEVEMKIMGKCKKTEESQGESELEDGG